MKTYQAYFKADSFDLIGTYIQNSIKAENIAEAKEKAEAIAEKLADINGCDVDVIDVDLF